jgi:hypothetical protein
MPLPFSRVALLTMIHLYSALFGKKQYQFFFSDDAVASDKLAHVLNTGKAELKETVAWANQTGKGLLFFSKTADQKDSPKGVIALVSYNF